MIVTFLVAGPPIPTLAGVGLGIGAVALMLSLLLTVASFFPSTNLEKHLVGDRERPTSRDNLLYYGHLARYEPRALVEAIAEMYFEQESEAYTPSKLAIDLAAQIVTNARITVRKLASSDIRCSCSGSACWSPPRPWRWRHSWSDPVSVRRHDA